MLSHNRAEEAANQRGHEDACDRKQIARHQEMRVRNVPWKPWWDFLPEALHTRMLPEVMPFVHALVLMVYTPMQATQA